MIEANWLIIFLIVGSGVGIIAGLLGVGGGGVLVPILTYIFLAMGMKAENVMHIALGTSMACIVLTSISSLNAHNKKGAVNWRIVKIMSFGIVLGTFVATYAVSHVNSIYLAVIFSSFMLWTAIHMLKGKTHNSQKQDLKLFRVFYASSGIGAMSALVSIGGGSLTVPYLVKNNFDMRKAIGTSAAIGLPISVSATLGYLINGWSLETGIENTIGFVYWPAVALISMTSFIFAPMGVKLAHYLPAKTLKRLFAILLLVLSAKMTFFVISH